MVEGCLTCRRRKVRCLGGTPCLNCSRMNVTCESSFHTNFRVRISTPTGQADLESNLEAPSQNAGHTDEHPPQAPSATPTLGPKEDHDGAPWPPHISQNPLPHQSPELYPDIQIPLDPLICCQGTRTFDTFLYPATWEFGSPAPSNAIPYHLPFVGGAQAAGSFVNPPACFDSSATAGIPDLRHVPAFSCEADSVLYGQDQEGTGTDWWAGGRQRW